MPVIDRDEAHFAQATKQMLQSGHFFQIRFQERTRFQKPPGINWLQAASVKLVGDAENASIWAYRIPSVLGALFSVLLLYFFARPFVGESIAKWGAALLASSLLLIVEAHMAVIDTSLLSSVVLMQGALWIIYSKSFANQQFSKCWPFLFWFAMAYGFLLKGVTPLVAVLTIVTLCLVEKRINWLKNLHIFKGLLLFFGLSCAWLYCVNEAEGVNYLGKMIDKDLLPKLKGGHESHGQPPLFHLALLPITFWPISLFLWQTVVYSFQQRKNKTVIFLLAWLLPTWLFFEIMPTKLPQYILPVFPALAILTAMALSACSLKPDSSKVLRVLQVLWCILTISLALVLAGLPWLITNTVSLWACSCAIGILILTTFIAYLIRNNSYKKAAATLLALGVMAYPLIFSAILPNMEPLWFTKNVVQLIDTKEISPTNPLLVVGFEEPSIVFNLNTNLVKFVDPAQAFLSLMQSLSSEALVEQTILNEWQRGGAAFTILGQIRGFNYSKGHWVELAVVKPFHLENNET